MGRNRKHGKKKEGIGTNSIFLKRVGRHGRSWKTLSWEIVKREE